MCECEVIFFNRTLLLFDVSVSVVMRGSAVAEQQLHIKESKSKQVLAGEEHLVVSQVSVGMSWTVNNGHFFFFLKQRSKMLELRLTMHPISMIMGPAVTTVIWRCSISQRIRQKVRNTDIHF
ncbi:hypothetical protein F2P79_011337 [Pimephales promelas]|nr:hypothetical protein F2P79_011337 [Pimephales promelas]